VACSDSPTARTTFDILARLREDGPVDFYSAYAHGFARVAACTVPVVAADPAANAAATVAEARVCHERGVAVAVFPELGLSGYAIDDLLLQDPLLEAVEAALADVLEASRDPLPMIVGGAPLPHGHRVLNCAVVLQRGRNLCVGPEDRKSGV